MPKYLYEVILMYEVYMITNTVNGKRYIGITKNGYMRRFSEHISSSRGNSKCMIHCAIRKYGVDNFSVSLLESGVSDDLAGDRERFYIALYNTYYKNRRGYNMTIGGNGTIGYIFTDEVRSRMSKANSGRKYSQERNDRIRQAMIGREYKREWRDALSAARIGKYCGESNSFYGKHHSDATKSIIGKRNTKYTVMRCDVKTGAVLDTYESVMAAARWVVSNGLSNNVNACNSRIFFVSDESKSRTAYGFMWRLRSSVSTNYRSEDELPTEAQDSACECGNDIVSAE